MPNLVGDPAVTETAVEVVPVRPEAANANVREPIVPVIKRFVKVPTPLALVVAVVVPPKVPPPLAIAAVRTTPDWLTGFPPASRS